MTKFALGGFFHFSNSAIFLARSRCFRSSSSSFSLRRFSCIHNTLSVVPIIDVKNAFNVFYSRHVFTAHTELRKVLFFGAACDFLFVYEISREPLNGFTPSSHGRRACSLARRSLNVKVKCQRSRSPGTKKRHFSDFSAACVRFMFGKTSLASS